MSFALDTTGSMAEEIEAARSRVTSIIESTRGTDQQPILYVLSPFNDPSKISINMLYLLSFISALSLLVEII